MTPKEWAVLLHAKMSDVPVEWGSDGDEIALFAEYLGAALRERDAAWAAAVKASGLMLSPDSDNDAWEPLRALLEEAGK